MRPPTTIRHQPQPAIILPPPPTTSHNFADTTHGHPRRAIILPPSPTTTHNLPSFHHHYPRRRTLLKNEFFLSYLFLKLKMSKEITSKFSKIFKNKQLIFSDVVGLVPGTLLKKKHLLPSYPHKQLL